MVHLPIVDKQLVALLDSVCQLVRDAGGRAWVVGGAVRDALLAIPVVDLDVEVHGIEAEDLERLLAEHHALDAVGRAFGVLKLREAALDVSLPRTESKAGLGHKGFLVQSDPHLDLTTAMSRRDFTINAMAYDPLNGELADPFNGQQDLANRLLRHCSPAFVEDPLRVLRGMQFVARFDLDASPDTIALCRTIDREGLAAERIWHEWRKLLLLGQSPSRGLAFLKATGWLAHFPDLAALVGVAQDPVYHPEGDVYTHTGLCLDAFADTRLDDETEDLVVGLAVLCHDFGKPLTTTSEEGGRIRSRGHAEKGVPVVKGFLEELTGQPALVAQVLPLVRDHARPLQLFAQRSSDGAVRRLARDVGRLDRLLRVLRADCAGRGAASAESLQAASWLEERARSLSLLDSRPEPLVQGRHLVERGIEPGPRFSEILNACFEAQLDGEFGDEAGGLIYLDRWLRQADRS